MFRGTQVGPKHSTGSVWSVSRHPGRPQTLHRIKERADGADRQAETGARRADTSRSRHDVPDSTAPVMIKASIAAAQLV